MSKRDIPNAAELEELQKKVSKLSSQLEAAEQARDKNAADLKKKTSEYDELRKTIDDEVGKAVKPVKAANAELETELKTAKATNAKLAADNAELEAKLKKAMELLKELEELKKKNTELMERVEAKKAEAAPAKGSTDDLVGFYTPEEQRAEFEDIDAALRIKERLDTRKQHASERKDMRARLS